MKVWSQTILKLVAFSEPFLIYIINDTLFNLKFLLIFVKSEGCGIYMDSKDYEKQLLKLKENLSKAKEERINGKYSSIEDVKKRLKHINFLDLKSKT